MPETSFESEPVSEAASPVETPTTMDVHVPSSSPVSEPTSTAGTPQPVQQPEYDLPPTSLGREAVKYLVSAIILGLGFAACVALYYSKQAPPNQSAEQLIPRVSTTAVRSFAGDLDMEVSGTVVPYREIRVAAEVSGNIVTKYAACEAGNFVKKGTKLLEIDQTDYKLQLNTRQAELDQSKRMLAETKEELAGAIKNEDLAKRDFEIAKEEYDRNQRIKTALSQAELDQAKRNLLNAEVALTNRSNNSSLIAKRIERMESAIALSESQLKRAALNLEKSTILAPDDGIIVSESVQEGEFVNPGTQLLTFEDTSRSEVICNLTPRDLEWIRENSPVDPEAAKKIEENKVLAVYYLPKTSVKVFEPERPEIQWQGELERFDGIGRDNRTRTIPTRITIEQPVVETDGKPHALVRGMYVKCLITVPVSESDQERRFLQIPAIALRPGNYVWVTENETIRRVDVDVVDRFRKGESSFVVIREQEGSLKRGELIVTSPISQPAEGMKVELEGDQPEASDADSENTSAEQTG